MLDGSERVEYVIRRAIPWDVMGGVARRAWGRNHPSIETCIQYNELRKGSDHIALPYLADDEMVTSLVADGFARRDSNR